MSRKTVLLFFFLFTPCFVSASNQGDVVINEICWMGTPVSTYDEWIELFNKTNNPISLDNWLLKAADGTPEIKLSGVIPANGFYLLERTDDQTLPALLADKIYRGTLSNSGEDLDLYDDSGNLIDEVNCSSAWLAGDNSSKQTMERRKTDWQTSQDPGGTPKTENSQIDTVIVETQKQDEQIEVEKNSKQFIYPDNIFINELLPSPEGSDEENEWVELFNNNNFEVDLSGWQIRDVVGSIKTYTLAEEMKIRANGFLILKRPETKIVLQNSGDGLELLNPNNEIIDQVSSGKAPQGQSFNRTLNGWFWSETLTPGKENIINQTAKEESLENKSQTKDDEGVSEIKKLSQAGISQNLPEMKNSNSLLIFISALLIAFISALIVWFLKKFQIKNG